MIPSHEEVRTHIVHRCGCVATLDPMKWEVRVLDVATSSNLDVATIGGKGRALVHVIKPGLTRRITASADRLSV